ncbi:MAG: hypothetical protein LBF65_01015 [Holosporales bacterium]|jgi:hypothetical protein|nr:hypothetical protein [Holosporales bacterium]
MILNPKIKQIVTHFAIALALNIGQTQAEYPALMTFLEFAQKSGDPEAFYKKPDLVLSDGSRVSTSMATLAQMIPAAKARHAQWNDSHYDLITSFSPEMTVGCGGIWLGKNYWGLPIGILLTQANLNSIIIDNIIYCMCDFTDWEQARRKGYWNHHKLRITVQSLTARLLKGIELTNPEYYGYIHDILVNDCIAWVEDSPVQAYVRYCQEYPAAKAAALKAEREAALNSGQMDVILLNETGSGEWSPNPDKLETAGIAIINRSLSNFQSAETYPVFLISIIKKLREINPDLEFLISDSIANYPGADHPDRIDSKSTPLSSFMEGLAKEWKENEIRGPRRIFFLSPSSSASGVIPPLTGIGDLMTSLLGLIQCGDIILGRAEQRCSRDLNMLIVPQDYDVPFQQLREEIANSAGLKSGVLGKQVTIFIPPGYIPDIPPLSEGNPVLIPRVKDGPSVPISPKDKLFSAVDPVYPSIRWVIPSKGEPIIVTLPDATWRSLLV